uniref:Uncharacterized protein n=1 Tax=Ascaris lumbricoides TaxID=6252 RepID=A0A0M3I5L9_ASCLU
MLYHIFDTMDQYDLYQDCYKSNFLTNTMRLYSRALPYLQTIPDGKQTAVSSE